MAKYHLPSCLPRDEFCLAFAAQLQARMAAMGWDVEETTRQVRLRRPTFGKNNILSYTMGLSLPSPPTLDAICKTLGCEPTDLVPYVLHQPPAAPPSLRAIDAGCGNAMLTVNTKVPWSVAMKILNVLHDEPAGA